MIGADLIKIWKILTGVINLGLDLLFEMHCHVSIRGRGLKLSMTISRTDLNHIFLLVRWVAVGKGLLVVIVEFNSTRIRLKKKLDYHRLYKVEFIYLVLCFIFKCIFLNCIFMIFLVRPDWWVVHLTFPGWWSDGLSTWVIWAVGLCIFLPWDGSVC